MTTQTAVDGILRITPKKQIVFIPGFVSFTKWLFTGATERIVILCLLSVVVVCSLHIYSLVRMDNEMESNFKKLAVEFKKAGIEEPLLGGY